MGFRQESNSSGLVEPEILSSDARRIHVRLRRGVCQIAKTSSIETQVVAYRRLEKHLANYRTIPIVGFDEKAGQVFQELRVTYPRLGSMDLKIAAISMVNQAILLTRNLSDFGQIAGLRAEDWTITSN